eukprot:TRINITY_DN4148_c0_g1_i11.p1 TRINITY_DN4148_c0_g1~~TRINITY_DN4148_c0_g1_i11.p1  ORF type:complete len:110 (+),score=21.54 TRINITY_DN4148_c0_g1_i11:222-551(+)
MLSAVWITAPDDTVASALATVMLQKKLVACVNLIPKIQSMYWWEGQIETSSEVLLMCKTRTALVPELTAVVKGKHPYAVCEVISAVLGEGNQDYYNWIIQSTKSDQVSE